MALWTALGELKPINDCQDSRNLIMGKNIRNKSCTLLGNPVQMEFDTRKNPLRFKEISKVLHDIDAVFNRLWIFGVLSALSIQA